MSSTHDPIHASRVLDVDEDHSNLNPIHGISTAPLLSLTDSLSFIVSQWGIKNNIRCANAFARAYKRDNSSCPLTEDEIASIHLYTQNSPFHAHMNQLLRARDRPTLKSFLSYLRLLATGLSRLKFEETTVYRGVPRELKFSEGTDVIWWSVSSTTSKVSVLANPQFLGTSGLRTQFFIHARHAVDISPFSAVYGENERVLLPGTWLVVKACLDVGAGLKQVQLVESDELPMILEGIETAPPSSSPVAECSLSPSTAIATPSSTLKSPVSSSASSTSSFSLSSPSNNNNNNNLLDLKLHETDVKQVQLEESEQLPLILEEPPKAVSPSSSTPSSMPLSMPSSASSSSTSPVNVTPSSVPPPNPMSPVPLFAASTTHSLFSLPSSTPNGLYLKLDENGGWHSRTTPPLDEDEYIPPSSRTGWTHPRAEWPTFKDVASLRDSINRAAAEGMTIVGLNLGTAIRPRELVTDAVVVEVARCCPDLQQLNVQQCVKLTDESIMEVARRCPLLQLNVCVCTKLTNAAIVEVARHCRLLQKLNVDRCHNLTDAAIEEVARRCPQMRQLLLAVCVKFTDAAIVEVARCSPQLQQLDVSNCSKLTDAAIMQVARHCPHLLFLNVSGCNLTDAAVVQVARSCPNLHHLNVMRCVELTDASILEMARVSPKLQRLDVGDCTKLTDNAIVELARHCPHLHQLNVYGCTELTDTAILAVAQQSPHLQQLIVGCCGKLTDAAIVEVARGCPQLHYLDLHRCTKLTKSGIDAVKQSLPRCTLLV